MKRCPECGGERFIATAHVTQDWILNKHGDYEETINDYVEATHRPNDDDLWECVKCGHQAAGSEFEAGETKLKIYEVERIRDDGKDEYKLQFWYLDYADAVDRFKKLIEAEKMVDWIAEALTRENDDWYQSELHEEIDYWCVTVDDNLDRIYSAVTITEREVF